MIRRTTLTTEGEWETEALGRAWADAARPGGVFLLEGDLGAGKTVFARGFVRAMVRTKSREESTSSDAALPDAAEEPFIVPSPTFTLLNVYPDGPIPVHHFDLYRLGDPEELIHLGAEEFLPGEGVALVEWPQRGGDLLPTDRLSVRIQLVSGAPDRRLIEIEAHGPLSEAMLASFEVHHFSGGEGR